LFCRTRFFNWPVLAVASSRSQGRRTE
jgi:hypothetical protein